MEPKPWVWPMRRQPGGGALARRGEGTFDSPSQSVPHAESPGLMRSGTWPALYCLYLSASCLSPRRTVPVATALSAACHASKYLLSTTAVDRRFTPSPGTQGRTDKNLCRCFGAPARRVFPDHLITYLLTYLRLAGFSLIT